MMPDDEQIISHNQRFRTGRIRTGKDVLFFKEHQPGMEYKLPLQREAYGLLRFADIVHRTQFPFKIPKLISFDESRLTTEYIEGEKVSFTDNQEYNTDLAMQFARAFVVVDKATRLKIRQLSKYSYKDEQGLFVWEILRKKLTNCGAYNLFDKSLLDRALRYLESHHGILEARFTHADLTENNTLRTNSGDIYLLDYESCRDDWPRWYDVVNFCYNRTIRRPELEPTMDQVMRYVRENCGEDDSTDQEIGYIQIVRALSIIIENLSEPGLDHNSSEEMTEDLRVRLGDSLTKLVSSSK